MRFEPQITSEAVLWNEQDASSDLSALSLALSRSLLVWWERHGRSGIPWMLLPGGLSPTPEQQLDPYGIWIAEVTRCSAAYTTCMAISGFLLARRTANVGPLHQQWTLIYVCFGI